MELTATGRIRLLARENILITGNDKLAVNGQNRRGDKLTEIVGTVV